MHADYKCDDCGEVLDVEFNITEGPPKKVSCPKCRKDMHRLWQAAIHIPEGWGDDLTTTISQRMAHAARPTGKQKINF